MTAVTEDLRVCWGHDERVKATLWFSGFVGLHLVLWTLLPSLLNNNLPLDVIEGLAWGHEWQFGYHKGPPLFAWLVELAGVIGRKTAWLFYLESQLCLLVTFFAVWRLGLRVIGPQGALAGVFLLEGIYYFGYPSPEFNEIILQMPFAALFGLWLYRALREGRMVDWIVTGLVTGAGLWSRYSMAAFILPLTLFVTIHPGTRHLWRKFGPYAAILAALITFLPHLFWIVETDFISLRYVGERGVVAAHALASLTGILKFAGSQALALLGMLLMLAVLAVQQKEAVSSDSGAPSAFDRSYVALLAGGPFATAIVLSLLSGHSLRSMWGGSLWVFAGLGAILILRPHLDTFQVKRLAVMAFAALVVSLSAYAIVQIGGPWLKKGAFRTRFPGVALASQVEKTWVDHTHEPLRFVVGDAWLAGNLGFYASSRPSVFIDGDLRRSPWIDLREIERHGAVLVWPANKEPAWMEQFPLAQRQSSALPGGSKNVPLEWAIVPPRS